MEVTAKVFTFKDQTQPAKAFVSFTFNGVFVVTGFKIVEGKNGLFLACPQSKQGDEWKDTAFPIDKEFREHLQEIAIVEFEGNNKPAPTTAKKYGSKK